jgi:cellulose synthase/poly-beta-1,6-N-acetylglucosamine synthase-like glycosyltransferase
MSSSPHTWQPIPLIRVEIDAPPKPIPVDVGPGRRIWMEALRRGHVVGVMETRTECGGVPASARSELARRFPGRPPPEDPVVPDRLLPRASVVVPTLCRNPPSLLQTIDALLAQDYPDFEVIVVDNRHDARGGPLPAFPVGSRVRAVEERRRGISAARNRGVATATGDIVAFTDDDAVAEGDWLRMLGSRFALDREVEAIGGAVLPSELQTEPQLWFEEFYGGFTRSYRAETLSQRREQGGMFPYAPARFGAGCNMAFRRSTLERTGGFITSLGTGTPARGGEDLAMFIELVTAGSTVAFEPAALVRHSHRRTRREFLRQVRDYGTGLTAMFTALIVRNPRHLVALLHRLPAGLHLLVRPRAGRSPSRRPSYPRRALAYQVLGMAIGPVAYARSAAMARWFE